MEEGLIYEVILKKIRPEVKTRIESSGQFCNSIENKALPCF